MYRFASSGKSHDGLRASRLQWALRLLYLFTLSVVMVVCASAGTTTSARRGRISTQTVFNSADALRLAFASQPARQLRGSAATGVTACEIVDAELDDGADRDAWSSVDAVLASSRALSSLQEAALCPRADLSRDPSRFARTTGLPRGPPV